MTRPSDRPGYVAREGFNLLHIIFTILAGLSLLAALGVLTWDAWSWLSGRGTGFTLFDAVLQWLLGSPPPASEMGLGLKALAILSLLPLGPLLAALAWIFYKIGNGFERLG